MSDKIRVLIVDDSAMMRRTIRQIIDNDRDIEVVATARDGEDALSKDREFAPDVITLDVNMPVMDGLTCLLYLNEQHPEAQVVMLSSLTQEGALLTFEALELGAFDFVAKPSGTVSSNLHVIGKELISKIKLAARSKKRHPVRTRRSAVPRAVTKVPRNISNNFAQKIVVIGASTGGPRTLLEILPELPPDLDAAVVVVQHMPPTFTTSFAKRLNDNCQLGFNEAKNGDCLIQNKGLVAPGGLHLIIKMETPNNRVRLTPNPSDSLFIPSVDVTMDSVVEAYASKIVGVLLTGMGSDGAEGMVNIKKAGGITIAESEETAVVFGMPREAIERGGADVVAPSSRIAKEIEKAVKRI